VWLVGGRSAAQRRRHRLAGGSGLGEVSVCGEAAAEAARTQGWRVVGERKRSVPSGRQHTYETFVP
jgi:hypothetical protein